MQRKNNIYNRSIKRTTVVVRFFYYIYCMELITKYIAIDSKEFKTEKECIEYENLLKEINFIMLANRVDAKKNLLELIKKHVSHVWVQETIDNNLHHSHVDRLLAEHEHWALKKAWFQIHSK